MQNSSCEPCDVPGKPSRQGQEHGGGPSATKTSPLKQTRRRKRNACNSSNKKRRRSEPGYGECFRSENWSTKETYDFIDLWRSYFNRLVGSTQKQVLYMEMAQRMMALGYRRNALQCRKKMQTLKDYYRKFRRQGLEGDLNWQFYSSVKNLLDKEETGDWSLEESNHHHKLDDGGGAELDGLVQVKVELPDHEGHEEDVEVHDERSGDGPRSVVVTEWQMDDKDGRQGGEDASSITESFQGHNNDSGSYYFSNQWDYKRAKLDSMEMKLVELEGSMTELAHEVHELRKERTRDAQNLLEAQKETTRGIRQLVYVVSEWLRCMPNGGSSASSSATSSSMHTPSQFLIPVYQLPKFPPVTRILPHLLSQPPSALSPSPPKSPEESWTVFGVKVGDIQEDGDKS